MLRVTWREVMFRQFTRRDIQMANKNMKKRLTSLVIKEIKIEKTNVIPCFFFPFLKIIMVVVAIY